MKSIENHLFDGAKLKIKRADHHIKDLVLVVSSFSHPDYYRLSTEKDLKRADVMLKFEILNEGIDDIPLIVGDAVHNLRTALDHLVCELVTRAGKPLTKHTRFAFWKTRQEAVAALSGIVQGVSLDVITSLLEYGQPYKGGNDALCTLHALDIADKHRLIVPLITIAGVTFDAIRGEQLMSAVAFDITRREKTYMIRLHSHPQIDDNTNPMLHVLFDGIEGLKQEPVIPTLHYLREVVSAVVQEVEKAMLASREWFSLRRVYSPHDMPSTGNGTPPK